MNENILDSVKSHHVITAIEDFFSGDYDSFFVRNGATLKRDARDWVVFYAGAFIPAKFLMAVACKFAFGKLADSNDFYGGDGSNSAGRRLRELGFDVVQLSESEQSHLNDDQIQIRAIRVRKQQQKFRRELILEAKCCEISGCSTEAALEACHIVGVASEGSYSIGNAILMRSDIHRLFDADLIWIDPESKNVYVDDGCPEYIQFRGKTLKRGSISQDALRTRWGVD